MVAFSKPVYEGFSTFPIADTSLLLQYQGIHSDGINLSCRSHVDTAEASTDLLRQSSTQYFSSGTSSDNIHIHFGQHLYQARDGPGYGQNPADGKPDPVIVWFCHNCGDGPLGNWRDQCLKCNHMRCGDCGEEET